MSSKSGKISQLLTGLEDNHLDRRYLGFFRCFNQQLYFEAHEVLEDLWLLERQGPNNNFYKGLIQLAGAFVHFQKSRTGPAIALLKLASANLSAYPAVYLELNIAGVNELIAIWLRRAAKLNPHRKALEEYVAPRLLLESARPLTTS